MSDPVLHVVAGPNGSGKTTFSASVLGPATGLIVVNADAIAAHRWGADAAAHAYEAASLAAEARARLIAERRSFAAETVFSHASKIELMERAQEAGYHITLHVLLVPEDAAVARVRDRVANRDGHDVPEDKIRSRYARLWPLVAQGIARADTASVYDNSSAARAFRRVATFHRGALVGGVEWPTWAPSVLRGL